MFKPLVNWEVIKVMCENHIWLEYEDFKSKVSIMFENIIEQKLTDVRGFIDKKTKNWEPNLDVYLVFDDYKIKINTRSSYLWSITNSQLDSDFSDEFYYFDSLVDVLTLSTIIGQNLKHVRTHRFFSFDNKIFNEGILLVLDKNNLHIYDNGDELGIDIINGNFEEKNYVLTD